MRVACACLVGALPLVAPDTPATPEWTADYQTAMTRAAAEKKVVFVAVNMDGEKGNDRMAANVYTDATIVELTQRTVCLIASPGNHTGSGACPRFGHIGCAEHRGVEAEVRKNLLKPDAGGYVLAPQHLFLGPDGKVLLSVPYEITAGELEWCLVEALRTVDPEVALELSERARAPKRLIREGVPERGEDDDPTPSRDELLELIDTLQRGTLRGPQRLNALRRVLLSEEEEALAYTRNLLRGQATRGSGRPAGGNARDERPRILRFIGARSPSAYWEITAEFLTDSNEVLRKEAAVALEQLSAPESTEPLRKAYAKEDSAAVAKNILRALGTAGAGDSKALRLVVKEARRAKDDVLRLNAIVALGSMTTDEKARKTLAAELESEDADTCIAAICAVAVSRDRAWLEALARFEDGSEGANPDVVRASQEARQVLTKGNMKPIERPLTRVARDEIPRTRFFGATASRAGRR